MTDKQSNEELTLKLCGVCREKIKTITITGQGGLPETLSPMRFRAGFHWDGTHEIEMNMCGGCKDELHRVITQRIKEKQRVLMDSGRREENKMMSDALGTVKKYDFLWPIRVKVNDLPYTKEDIAAWKHQHIDGDKHLTAAYTAIAAGERPRRVRIIWLVARTFLPIVGLAILANFVSSLSVALLSCIMLPVCGIALLISVFTVIGAKTIQAFVEIEKEIEHDRQES